MNKFSVLALSCLLSIGALAQGTITGKVLEATTGESLIGCNVYISNDPMKGGNADLDGNYAIKNLAPGTYSVTASFISFENQVLEGIVVQDGDVTSLDFNLGENVQIIEGGAVVEVRQNKREDLYMMKERSRDAAPIDFRSAKDIQKSGDSDVGSALKRVTGVSTVGNYVFVRGLSDRYIKTTLNKHVVPTLDPRRNSIQMDIFPTGSIDNLVIRKGYTADLPGDWAGAFIDIQTKDFPDSLQLRYSVSLGYNENATFQDVIGSQTSSTDWLGFDNGFRDLNSDVQSLDGVPQVYMGSYYEALVYAGYADELSEMGINEISDIGQNGTMSIFQVVNGLDDFNNVEDVNVVLRELRANENEDLSNYGKSFGNTWDTEQKKANMNMSHSLSVGNQVSLFGRQLGFNLGGQWNQKNTYYNNGQSGRYTLTGLDTNTDQLNLERSMSDEMGTVENNWSLLGNLSYRLAENHALKLVWMSTAIGTNESRYQNGINPSDDPNLYHQQRMQRYTERALNTFQLNGDHTLTQWNKASVNWGIAYTNGKEDTPDFRLLNNSYEIGEREAIYNESGVEITDQLEGLSDNIDYWIDEGDITGQDDPAIISLIESEYGVQIGEIGSVVDTVYSIRDNLYPSPTRFYRTMKDQVWDVNIDVSIPFVLRASYENTLKIGASRVSTSRDYDEKRFTFV
ncbi:MAG: hypothetical protein ACI9P8_001743, partial [Bacteroidia bacterium]